MYRMYWSLKVVSILTFQSLYPTWAYLLHHEQKRQSPSCFQSQDRQCPNAPLSVLYRSRSSHFLWINKCLVDTLLDKSYLILENSLSDNYVIFLSATVCQVDSVQQPILKMHLFFVLVSRQAGDSTVTTVDRWTSLCCAVIVHHWKKIGTSKALLQRLREPTLILLNNSICTSS